MAVPRAFTPAIPGFLAAFTGTLIFKIALFRYSTSGAEGISSALATWPRIVLCLGWDIVSALIVAGVAAMLWWPAAVEAVYGVFLVVSYHIATIVGTPLDKAAIDLLFFYNATPGHTGRLFADSVVPYVTPGVVIEAVLAAALMPAVFFWWRRRVERGPAIGGRGVAAFAVLVFLTVAVVPGLGERAAGDSHVRTRTQPADTARRLVRVRAGPSADGTRHGSLGRSVLFRPALAGANRRRESTREGDAVTHEPRARDPGIHLLAKSVGGTNADAFSGRARAIVKRCAIRESLHPLGADDEGGVQHLVCRAAASGVSADHLRESGDPVRQSARGAERRGIRHRALQLC